MSKAALASPLSARELEIIKAVSLGSCVKAIAHSHGLSYYAVNSRLQIMRRIVGAKNTPHLIAVALRNRWIK